MSLVGGILLIPVVTDPSCLLDFNRYMYARNNPMLYTDLNGASFKDWWRKNVSEPFMREWHAVFGNGFTVSVGTNMQFQGGSLTVFPNAPNGMPYGGGFGIETNNFKTGYPVFANYQNGFVSTQAVNYETNLQHAVITAETNARNEIYAKETAEQDNNYNFFYRGNKTDRFLRFAAEYIDDGGVEGNTIVINAHGNNVKINAPTASGTMRPKELHEYLLSNNKLYQRSYYHGEAIIVRIIACNTGNGFAQEFSSYNHHMLVYAPSTRVWNILGVNFVKPGSYFEFWRGK